MELVAFFLPVVALVAAIAAYLNDRERNAGKRRSLILFVIGFLVAGAVLAWFGSYAALLILCPIFQIEQCNWLAIFTFPAFFGLGAGIFVYLWYAKHPNNRLVRTPETTRHVS